MNGSYQGSSRGWLLGRPGRILVAVALASAAAAIFVHPWWPNDRTVPTTYRGDSAYFAQLDSSLWTFLLAWGARHPDRPYEPPILVPLAAPATANDPRLFEQWWATPIFRALEPIRAWGVTTCIALLATALSAWWAGWRLTGSAWGGGGFMILFSYGTFRAAHVMHVEAMAAPFLPLVPVALAQIARAPSPPGDGIGAPEGGSPEGGSPAGDTPSILGAGVLLGLAAVDYSYTAFALGLALPVAFAWMGLSRRAAWGRLAIAALAAIAVVALFYGPIAVRYAAFHAATGLERTAWEVDAGSAGLRAWLTGPDGTLLPPFGGAGEYLPDSRLFPGFLLLGLAVAGFRATWRSLPAILVLGLVALAASIGTGRPLLADLGLDPPRFALPWDWLHENLLPVRAIRAPARLAVVAHLALAVSGAWAIAGLSRRGTPGRVAAAALLLAALLEARLGMHEVSIRPDRLDDPAYAWLAEQPAEGAVLEMPMGMNSSFPTRDFAEAESLLAFLRHGKPTPNGTMALVLPWHDAIAIQLQRPRPGRTREMLEALGVRWVVAGDETSVRAAEVMELAEAWRSPTGLGVYRVDSPASIPLSPAAFQERMAAWMPRTPIEGDSGWSGWLTVPTAISALPGAPIRIRGTVWNTGSETWSVRGALYGVGPAGDIQVATRAWTAADGAEWPRSLRGRPLRLSGPILADVAPGESAPFVIAGFAPRRRGTWHVELGLEARGLFPLVDAGHPPAILKFEVR